MALVYFVDGVSRQLVEKMLRQKRQKICKVSASSHYQSKIRPDTLNYVLEEELFWEIEAQKG